MAASIGSASATDIGGPFPGSRTAWSGEQGPVPAHSHSGLLAGICHFRRLSWMGKDRKSKKHVMNRREPARLRSESVWLWSHSCPCGDLPL